MAEDATEAGAETETVVDEAADDLIVATVAIAVDEIEIATGIGASAPSELLETMPPKRQRSKSEANRKRSRLQMCRINSRSEKMQTPMSQHRASDLDAKRQDH